MNKCKTCSCLLHASIESKQCPDCLQEANLTGFQDNEDPFEDWQIEGFNSKEERDKYYETVRIVS